jgi:hypothetical protein
MMSTRYGVLDDADVDDEVELAVAAAFEAPELEELDDEVDELPHAASSPLNATTSAATASRPAPRWDG